MQIIIIFLIWYFAFGKYNPKYGKDRESKIGFIIVALIAFSLLGGVLTVASIMFSLIGQLLTMGIPIMIVMAIYKALSKNVNDMQNKRERVIPEPRTGKSGLVKSSSKRKRILSKFSKKYNLFLGEKEIDRICDASYSSYGWEQEVVAMTKDYDSVSEWYSGNTGWLRAYMRAFSVQSISSDFELQRRICFDSFAQVFDSIDMEQYPNIDACIEDLNSRFYTYFDEATFMIAYRFMEANGRKYKLPDFGVYRYESELDKLKHKYDQDTDSNVVDMTRNRIPLR